MSDIFPYPRPGSNPIATHDTAPVAAPVAEVTLAFAPPGEALGTDKEVRLDLSGVERYRDTLFLGSDETSGIEVLRRGSQNWGEHVHIPLHDFFDLPGGPEGEMDIEGVAVHQNWLWLTGSHALKRGNARGIADPTAAMKKLGRLRFDINRQFVGRLPICDTPDGPRPVLRDGDRRAGHLKFTKSGKLRKWLSCDPLLGPFVDLPSKDNGLDIEGLAVLGNRLWLGLRGPVLRGYASIVELELKADKKGRLKAKRIDGRRRYRLHLLPTAGAGVRDLVRDGDDLLALLGPAMAGDGATSVLRWRDGVHRRTSGVWNGPEVETALELPYRDLKDNPEGLTRWDADHCLIIHDSPAAHRLSATAHEIRGDLWRLPRRDASPLPDQPQTEGSQAQDDPVRQV
ncbi:MAG: DUF3616 domain-containing protein [Pseudomonadota bacterium]